MLFYIPFLGTAIGGFVNTQMTFLLQSPEYFKVDQANIGTANSKLLFSTFVACMLFTPVCGYIFDLFGRRIPLLLALLSAILLTFLMPHSAPNFTNLLVVRTGVGLSINMLTCSPLVVDYIKKQSRGTAVSLQTMGMLLGEAFAMIALVNFIAGYSIQASYSFATIVLGTLLVVPVLFLREPKIHDKV